MIIKVLFVELEIKLQTGIFLQQEDLHMQIRY